MRASPRNTVLVGDALTWLPTLPANSIDSVITSPPYYALRDYGIAGQFGHEATVDEWVANLRAVCRELHRVLAPHGSLWLNLGDSYSRHRRFGASPKSLLLGPERLARLLIADGWVLRNKVVWAKTNPLPSPSKDRLTTTHEVVYFLTTQPSYFFDLDAIREPITSVRQPTKGSCTPQAALGVLAGNARQALEAAHDLIDREVDEAKAALAAAQARHDEVVASVKQRKADIDKKLRALS